jgi:hypothetical protein
MIKAISDMCSVLLLRQFRPPQSIGLFIGIKFLQIRRQICMPRLVQRFQTEVGKILTVFQVCSKVEGLERYEQDWATESLAHQYLKNKRSYNY